MGKPREGSSQRTNKRAGQSSGSFHNLSRATRTPPVGHHWDASWGNICGITVSDMFNSGLSPPEPLTLTIASFPTRRIIPPDGMSRCENLNGGLPSDTQIKQPF